MFLKLWLETIENTKNRIKEKITTVGIPVKRGIKKRLSGKQYASDVGDFGQGKYYSTSYFKAKQYGLVEKLIIKFNNPEILMAEEAYDLADHYHTISLPDNEINDLFVKVGRNKLMQAIEKQKLENAQKLTNDMISAGYDGLVVINRNDLEIVDYRK